MLKQRNYKMKYDSSTITSILSLITSISVAIFSFIQSRANNKQIVKNKKELEMFQLNIHEQKTIVEINEKHRKIKMDSIMLFITEIQKLKDNLKIIINSSNQKLDSETAKKMIEKISSNFFNLYEQNCGFLDKEENQYIHKMKNMTYEIKEIIESNLEEKEYVILSDDQKNILRDKSAILTDYQNMIRDLKDRQLRV